MGATGGGMVSRVELCREASPAAEGGRAGKKRREKGRKVCVFYMLTFSSFFCASLQTQKGMVLLCISLCIHKKEKNVYVKLHTANKAGVMRAYVYVCILESFVQVYLHIFSAGSPAGGNPCGQQEKYVCLYVQKRKQNVYVYIHKKKNKMYMFTYAKFEVICIA